MRCRTRPFTRSSLASLPEAKRLKATVGESVSVNSFLDTFVSQIMLPQPTYNIAHV